MAPTTVPEGVRKQIEEADKLHRQLYPDQYPDSPPAAEPPAGTPEEEIEGTPPQEAPQEVPPAPEGEEPPAEPPSEVPPQPTPPEEAPPVIPLQDTTQLQQQLAALQTAHQKLQESYKILQNKYNLGKHNEEYRAALESRDNRIATLEAEISSLRERLAAPPATPAGELKSEVTADLGELKAKIQEDVGEDTFKNIDTYINLRIAQSVDQKLGTVGQEMSTVRQEIDSVRSEDQKRRGAEYVTDLTELCPDWEAIKADPGFSEYLAQRDVASGRSRYDLAKEGAASLDAERVAHFYNGYKREIGLSTETPTEVVPRGTKPNPPKKGSKERLIAPVSDGKSITPPPDKPLYTQAQLIDIANRVIKLTQAGKHEEAKKLQAERDAAIAEGRILR